MECTRYFLEMQTHFFITISMCFLVKGEPPSISQTVNFADFVSFLIQIRCFNLLIMDSSRICRDHLAEDSQDDSQSKCQVSKIYNVVFVVFCSDQ